MDKIAKTTGKLEKAELEAQLGVIREKLWKIERAEATEACKKLIGKCFKTENCYSDDKRWPVYIKVTGVRNGLPEIFQFEIRTGDGSEFLARFNYGFHTGISGMKPISNRRFERAFRSFLRALIRRGAYCTTLRK